MSTGCYSMTCIGLKVPRRKIIREREKLKNQCCCKPQVDPNIYPGAIYCPYCGWYIRKSVTVSEPLFDMPEDYYNEETRIKGWKVEHDTDARNFYICILTTGYVEHEEKSPIPDISDEYMTRFISDMESAGLWDEDKFGLWTVTYCSH